MATAVWSLRWVDVDPTTHPYSGDTVRAVVEPLVANPPQRGSEKEALQGQLDRALMAEFGHWVTGWTWAASEPGGGGPVTAYCCARDSLKGSSQELLTVVLGAVENWRQRLAALSQRFEKLREAASELEVEDAVSRAATDLLPLVVEWTHAEDAWYNTYQTFVSWYVESLLGESAEVPTLVGQAIGGRFESWIEPSEEAARQVPQDIARTIADKVGNAPLQEDMLVRWMKERNKIQWRTERFYSPEPVSHDGHERFIETFDRKRDGERAQRMSTALRAARQAAKERKPLTLQLLSEWQAIILGEAVEFRGADAYAHRGAERYGLQPRTLRKFENCLKDAFDSDLPSVVRAARVYLDVCFFHPFPDGNGRLARLALDYVLSRDGLALHTAEPVFLVARRAADSGGAFRMQYLVDYLAGPNQQI